MTKKRILLVEDEATVAILIQESLSDLEPFAEVCVVGSGFDALKEMQGRTWDLVVTDYRMPGMNGLELLETLRERMPATQSILITAYGSEEVERAARRLNVFRYMTKPFPLVDLKRVIRQALALNEQQAAPRKPTPPEKETRSALKITLGGEGSVGKTTLIRRLCTDEFRDGRAMTIGVDFHLYDLDIDSTRARLIVWDVSGQERFEFTRRAFYRGSKAVGLVYDVTSRSSFERVAGWRNEILAMVPNVAIVLAGNKADLQRQVTHEEGQTLADSWGIPFLETSCASGEGVRDFFTLLAQRAAESFARSENSRIAHAYTG